MREGSLEAPTRHPIPWEDPDFYDTEKLDVEMRRQFDVCHGCRRCFNLCDSFPRLFDLIDESKSGELDTVESADFERVVDGCTLCDMCFMTKCPYVPPHEFDIDFPHLMLRYRAARFRTDGPTFAEANLTETDRNGRLGCSLSGLVNWASKRGNGLTRPVMEKLMGVHRDAELPRYDASPLVARAKKPGPEVNAAAPAAGRKAVIYATCFANWNEPDIGDALRGVLARNGVETEVLHPVCCGMPQLEQGNLARVVMHARRVSVDLAPYIDGGFDIVAPVSSCALMLKFEWPLLLPGDERIEKLAKATFDASEYLVDIARNEGLADGLKPVEGGVTVHVACHARAQNMGRKAEEMLKHLPDTDIHVIERCSGHGGSWGIMKENFETGMKVGKPVARKAKEFADGAVVSECPLAQAHVLQGIEALSDGVAPEVKPFKHPIQVLAHAYGL